MPILRGQSNVTADLASFLAPFGRLVKRAQSQDALQHYVAGLIADIPRKTASEIARALPQTNSQRLQEFVARTAWDAGAMTAIRIRHMVAHASIGAGLQVVDRSTFAKKGSSSVGVERQAAVPGGREENCQLVVTTHYADRVFSWPAAARLYLPEGWAQDARRRDETRVPESVAYASPGEIALSLIEEGIAAGVPMRAVVAEAGFDREHAFLAGLESRGAPYIVRLSTLRPFVPLTPASGDAPVFDVRPRNGARAAEGDDLVASIPESAWHTVAWALPGQGPTVRQFARVRVRRVPARLEQPSTPAPSGAASMGWLLAERPVPGYDAETAAYYAWGLDGLALDQLAELASFRTVARSYDDLARREFGLCDYEGRLWPGFHHHLALVMLAYCYRLLSRSYGGETAERPGRHHS